MIFLDSYLELDRRNMVSILAFDSNTIGKILCEENFDYFQKDYPIFYQNKHEVDSDQAEDCDFGHKFTNALHVAIENNQIRAVGKIIDHIVMFQNNFVSSYLFEDNLLLLLEKAIDVNRLLNSKVFQYQFDYEGWPRVHQDTDQQIVPYNGSIFKLRNVYDEVFPDVAPVSSS